jgi:putative ABC transport system permease protein
VSEDYFRALGVPLLSGRAFEARDVLGGERVALVNRRFVETYWPGLDPVGRRVRASSMEGHIPGGAPWLTVIGVVDDLRHWGHEREVDEEIYVQHRQLPTMVWSMTAVVRTDPARVGSLRETVRGEIAALDRTLAVDVRLLDERVASLLGTRRLVMSLLTGFAGLAVLLSAIGVYGLLSFAVAQRTREIGVRAALGARQGGIVRLMLGSALRVVALGTALGLVGAFWLTRLMDALLFGITPGDWVSYAAAALILLAVSVVAAFVPAWRASRLDPLIALRQS